MPGSAADPGFPQGWGANSPGGGGRQHTILPNFPENCMKSEEFGRPGGGGGAPPATPLNPPLRLAQMDKHYTLDSAIIRLRELGEGN